MVGVSGVNNWGRKVVGWLEKGGREGIYAFVKELESRYCREGLLRDFSCYIGLPSDVILYCRHRQRGVGIFYTYPKAEIKEAMREAENWNQNPGDPEYEVSVMSAAEHFGLKEDEVYTDFSWHGYAGAALVFQAIGELIERETGVRVRL